MTSSDLGAQDAGSPHDEPPASPSLVQGKTSAYEDRRPEIVIGIVSPLGVDLSPICDALTQELDYTAGYKTEIVQVSWYIDQLRPNTDSEDPADRKRIRRLMNAGDDLRKKSGTDGICAMLAILGVQEKRESKTGSDDVVRSDGAYIIRQLKHPDEVQVLREVYGSRFILVGVTDTPEAREKALRARLMSPSGGSADAAWAAGEAAELLRRDDNDEKLKHGQHVRDAFALCDVYLSAGKLLDLKAGVRRLVNLLFGEPFTTPSRDEMGVWHAFAAKYRSAASGRQVGAVITDADGEILVTGCNDVPAPGGGQNWDQDKHDFRDYTLGYEANDHFKYAITTELMDVLKNAGWFNEEITRKAARDLAERALDKGDGKDEKPILKGRRIASLLEFGRIMHAEMAALMTAARRGTPVRDGTLYTTTYPCHECMRLIIGAGITRVVYIDPYPKSLVTELFDQQLSATDPGIVIEQFLGIAPRLVRRVFDQADGGRTRQPGGEFDAWDGKTAAFKGETTRYVDSTLAKEVGIAAMLEDTYLERVEEAR